MDPSSRATRPAGSTQPIAIAGYEDSAGQSLVSRRVTTQTAQITKQPDETDWDYQDDVDPAHVAINPKAVGRLDFPPREYEDDLCGCCCCCCKLPRCCYKRRMGAAFVLWERKDPKTGDDKVVLMCGAAWPSALITASLLLGVPLLAYTLLLPTLSSKFWYMAAGFWITVFMIFVRTSCGDPGLCPRYLEPKHERWRYYYHTGSFRPPKVGFCSSSQLLFYEIDHFCPWMGTTIARDNLCYFYLTLACIPATAVFLMVLTIASATNEFTLRHPH